MRGRLCELGKKETDGESEKFQQCVREKEAWRAWDERWMKFFSTGVFDCCVPHYFTCDWQYPTKRLKLEASSQQWIRMQDNLCKWQKNNWALKMCLNVFQMVKTWSISEERWNIFMNPKLKSITLGKNFIFFLCTNNDVTAWGSRAYNNSVLNEDRIGWLPEPISTDSEIKSYLTKLNRLDQSVTNLLTGKFWPYLSPKNNQISHN